MRLHSQPLNPQVLNHANYEYYFRIPANAMGADNNFLHQLMLLRQRRNNLAADLNECINVDNMLAFVHQGL
jgi:hypothetical protein